MFHVRIELIKNKIVKTMGGRYCIVSSLPLEKQNKKNSVSYIFFYIVGFTVVLSIVFYRFRESVLVYYFSERHVVHIVFSAFSSV